MTEPSNTTPRQTPNHLLKQLQKDFSVFAEFKPLAIGIDKQVIEQQPDINKKLLRVALGFHTKSVRYLKSLQTEKNRFNLDGSTAGEIDDAQRTHAGEQLREFFKARAQARKVQEAEEAAKAAEQERQQKLLQLADKFSRK